MDGQKTGKPYHAHISGSRPGITGRYPSGAVSLPAHNRSLPAPGSGADNTPAPPAIRRCFYSHSSSSF
ncbi:hypothetical protein LOS09_06555, partial [Proteus mirabilis]|uniref:hypothetical protein n=1 Tax=Proteus mirabilis TaxID=584 RepID=UPI001E4EF389